MAATILFLYGQDTYRSAEKLQALKRRYIDASLGDTNLATLDGASLTFQELVRQVQAFPFLAKTRLVVIHNLLLSGKKDVQEALVDYLDSIPDTTVLCLYEAGAPDKRTMLYKRLAKLKFAEEYSPLTPPQVQVWLMREADRRGVRLAPPAAQWLVEVVGTDLWRLHNELDKLADWSAGGQPITRVALEDLVIRDESADVFALVTAVVRGRTREALMLTEVLRTSGEAELYLLSMLAYQYRTMIVVADALASGARTSGEVAQVTGLKPFVVQKTMDLVRSMTVTDLLDRYDRILATDAHIKTGTLPPRDGLELLIVELAAPATPARR